MFYIFLALFAFQLSAQSDNACSDHINKTIKPRANDASAVCMHEKKKYISKAARTSIKRIKKLKKKAQKRRKRELVKEEKDETVSKGNPLFENHLSSEAFNQNILIQIASECNHFNVQLSKALINLRKSKPECQKDLMYDVYLSSWRLNNKILKNFIDKRLVVKTEGGKGKLVDPELESYQNILKGFSEFEGSTPVYIKDPYASYPADKRKPANRNKGRTPSRSKPGAQPANSSGYYGN